jgi:hypothetical protein
MSPSDAAQLFTAVRDGRDEALGALDGVPVLQVDLDEGGDELADLSLPPWLPCVVIGFARRAQSPAPRGVDLAVAPAEDHAVPSGWVTTDSLSTELAFLGRYAVGGWQAAVTLAQVLRTSEFLDVDEGLTVESLAYSMLQGGPGFKTWLDNRPAPHAAADHGKVLLVERDGAAFRLTLNRPHVHNAVSSRLRDELCEALTVACADPSIREITLRGAGPSFSSGGDLNEFGTLPDLVSAHLTRTTRSPARLLATLSPRVTAYVHGACVGAGIELAAFAGRVVAAPDAQFSLPEFGMWLIPGAGGTVSIPRRIGRQRTMWLALRSVAIDATTALAWGLVDEISGA